MITRVYGPRYKQAILLMTFLGGLASTFGIPFTQFLVERIGWRPALEVHGGHRPGRRASCIHWLIVPGPKVEPVPIAALEASGRRAP